MIIVGVFFCTSCRFRFWWPIQLPIRKQKEITIELFADSKNLIKNQSSKFQTKARIGNRQLSCLFHCRFDFFIIVSRMPIVVVIDFCNSCRFRLFLPIQLPIRKQKSESATSNKLPFADSKEKYLKPKNRQPATTRCAYPESV